MTYGPVVANISATNTGTTEAVVATSPTVASTPAGGAGYMVEGVVTFTGNASASTCTLKIRQNSVSGTTVYTSPAITVAAAAVVSIPIGQLDLSAAASGVANYVITQTNSAAAGASGAVTGYIKVTSAQEND
jgi:hypothetical protein